MHSVPSLENFKNNFLPDRCRVLHDVIREYYGMHARDKCAIKSTRQLPRPQAPLRAGKQGARGLMVRRRSAELVFSHATVPQPHAHRAQTRIDAWGRGRLDSVLFLFRIEYFTIATQSISMVSRFTSTIV